MTGTSLDGLDVALVEVAGAGLTMRAKFVRGWSVGLGRLAGPLRTLAEQRPMAAGDIASLANEFSRLHVRAIRTLLVRSRPQRAAQPRCDLICVHGQTVFHAPPLSWQVMQPAPIAQAFGVPVVFDLRQADLAAGGEGAPITPIADWVLFREAGPRLAVVNLGGFANLTRWAKPVPEAISGQDLSACNHVLDAVSRRVLGTAYDKNGAKALGGVADNAATRNLMQRLRSQSKRGRSLGTGDEIGEWVAKFGGRVSRNDLAASACEAIGQLIGGELLGDRLALFAGGGTRNRALMAAIRRACPSTRVELTTSFGVPSEYREAACFAVLGALCEDRVPITLPAVTRVAGRVPVAGAIVRPY